MPSNSAPLAPPLPPVQGGGLLEIDYNISGKLYFFCVTKVRLLIVQYLYNDIDKS